MISSLKMQADLRHDAIKLFKPKIAWTTQTLKTPEKYQRSKSCNTVPDVICPAYKSRK